MAGTRCANPTYQLDVDTMMVEYVLYRSIEAHLELLVVLSEQQSVRDIYDGALIRDRAASGLRLTEMYDLLVTLYKNNHGDIFSNNTQREGRILQFLMQLNWWVVANMKGLDNLTPQMSKEMRERQQQDMIINQSCRRIWLKAKGELKSLNSDSDAHSWQIRNQRLSPADHLLPPFIRISADLFEISKSPRLSMEWMELATHFMVQAAIDILEDPDMLACGPDVMHNLLQECFAWGSLEKSHAPSSVETVIGDTNMRGFVNIDTREIDRITTMEARCQEMFRDHFEMTNGVSGRVSLSSSQTPSWDLIKQNALEDVLITFTSMQEAGEELVSGPIELLKKKYSLAKLLVDINDFISVHWKLLHSKAWHGKPMLLQIEEGGIEGLTLDEFEDFKDRAGIRDMWSITQTSDED